MKVTKRKVQFSSATQSCPTLCLPMDCSTPGFLFITNSWSLLKLISIKQVTKSNYLSFCNSLFFLRWLLTIISVFSNESFLHIRWPKDWSFRLSISPYNEYSGVISFRMDWLDLLASQGTRKSLLQCHGTKASILRHSAFKFTSKFGKLSSGHRTGKGESSFQSLRKAMPKMLKLPHNCTYLTR